MSMEGDRLVKDLALMIAHKRAEEACLQAQGREIVAFLKARDREIVLILQEAHALEMKIVDIPDLAVVAVHSLRS